MRRSRLGLAATLTLLLCATLSPAVVHAVTVIGPGGWAHVGLGYSGTPLNDTVLALNTDDTDDLYVGGAFTDAGLHEDTDRIGEYNGFTWGDLGGINGVPLTNGEVRAIEYADGRVYVGGTFQDAGGDIDADFLAMWDGNSWEKPCTSLGPAFNGNVNALQVIGTRLFVGGEFQDGAGLAAADSLIACDLATGAPSSTVSDTGDLAGIVHALAADSNDVLYVGGAFSNADQIPAADNVAAYSPDTGTWQAMGTGPGPAFAAVPDVVRSVTASGTTVYVGTDALDVAGLANADHVARWNGSAWAALGSNSAGTDGWLPAAAQINAVRTYGPLVIAAGSFENANGQATADNIAQFDGTTWRPVGSNGAGDGPLNGEVHALAIFDGKLHAGGSFTTAGGNPGASYLASHMLRLPDASISRLRWSGYVGDGVYAQTGQARTVSIKKGRSGQMFVRIQNDGLVSAAFLVKATGRATGISVSYFRTSTGNNITSAVRAGTYTATIPPRGAIVIRMRITVKLTSAFLGTYGVSTRAVNGIMRDGVTAFVKTYR